MERKPDDIRHVFDRSFGDRKEELRVSLAEYEGRKFVSPRMFWLSKDGQWLPGKQGCTIRLKELEKMVEVLRGLL